MNTFALTVEEVAAYLKLAPVTIYRELVKRRLPGFKVGNQWRIRKDILDDWIEERSGWQKRFDRLWTGFQKQGRRQGVTEDSVAREVKAARKAKH
jgi:excisionase family DNA binding protein